MKAMMNALRELSKGSSAVALLVVVRERLSEGACCPGRSGQLQAKPMTKSTAPLPDAPCLTVHGVVVYGSTRSRPQIKLFPESRLCACLAAQVAQVVCMGFPVLPIERLYYHLSRLWLEASSIDAVAVGVGAGHVE